MTNLVIESYSDLFDLMCSVWRSNKPEAKPVYVAYFESRKYDLDDLKNVIFRMAGRNQWFPTLSEINREMVFDSTYSRPVPNVEENAVDPKESAQKAREIMQQITRRKLQF